MPAIKFDTQLLLQAFGVIFAGIGVVVRLGVWKQWYWRTKTAVYSYLPIGIIFIMVSFNDQMSARLGANFWIFEAAYVLPIALGIWWVVRTPEFVKPDWVRWVEKYPPETIELMRLAALKDPKWEHRVTSPKEVDAWARHLQSHKPKQKASSKTGK